MTLAEHIRLNSARTFIVLGIVAFGSTIGSFVNVLVYRLPRGESVIWKPSHCPVCNTPIAGRDNIPIFGWLLLAGRCRSCDVAISCRYPLVETIVAAAFIVLLFAQLLSGGGNIPIRSPNMYGGIVWILFYTKWDLVRLYLYHCYVFSLLLTWALIQWDAKRIPIGAMVVGLGIALGLPVFWPDLLPVQWFSPVHADSYSHTYTRPDALTTLLAGAAMGLVASQILSQLRRLGCFGVPRGNCGSWAGFVLLGIGLGWQAILTISFLVACVTMACKLVRRFWTIRPLRSPQLLILLLVGFLYHTLWRWLFGATARLWCFPQAGLGSLVFWMTFTSVSLVLIWCTTRQKSIRRARASQ